jgi:hypothetical protein
LTGQNASKTNLNGMPGDSPSVSGKHKGVRSANSFTFFLQKGLKKISTSPKISP